MADGLVITGPTASGKTALSIALAERIGGEIISMDSRQVYRGMDIGTAKATPSDRARVPHHGLDLVPPNERYNAGRFATDARGWIRDIRGRGRVPVLVGGTGFFLRALTQPMFSEPPLDKARKEALKRYLERYSRVELLRWLRALDQVSAARMTTEGGRQRIARAIEIALLTGRTLTEWHAQAQPEKPLHFVTFVLELPRDLLYERINQRVDQMIDEGLVEEVRGLLDAGFDQQSPGLNATGYSELIPYLRGEVSLEEAKDAIRRATRSYARRQTTWFRHQLGPDAIRLDATRPPSELTDEIVQRVGSV